jgi:hypothetical protein
LEELKIPISEIGTEIRTLESFKDSTGFSYKVIDFNLSIANDVIEVLREIKFDKFIVLENFHYLSDETQKLLAFDLRNFQDADINFIILGIWRELNRLCQYNGDLLDRSVEIPVEPWLKEDFIRVIDKGCQLLNVSMQEIQEDLIEAAFDSIGVLQELCKECCLVAEVDSKTEKVIISKKHLEKAIDKKYHDYSGRHIRSFESFGSRMKESSGDWTAYYLLNAILELKNNNVESGLSKEQLENRIKINFFRNHSSVDIDLHIILKKIKEYQLDCTINPPLFDYDLSLNKLVITDSTLYFFLKHCNAGEIDRKIRPSSL